MGGLYNTLDALLYAYAMIDRWAKMSNPNHEPINFSKCKPVIVLDEKDYEVHDG